jgi:hypothetical protein
MMSAPSASPVQRASATLRRALHASSRAKRPSRGKDRVPGMRCDAGEHCRAAMAVPVAACASECARPAVYTVPLQQSYSSSCCTALPRSRVQALRAGRAAQTLRSASGAPAAWSQACSPALQSACLRTKASRAATAGLCVRTAVTASDNPAAPRPSVRPGHVMVAWPALLACVSRPARACGCASWNAQCAALHRRCVTIDSSCAVGRPFANKCAASHSRMIMNNAFHGSAPGACACACSCVPLLPHAHDTREALCRSVR